MAAYPGIMLGEVIKPFTRQAEIKPLETYKQITVKLWGKGLIVRNQVLGSEIGTKRIRIKQGQFVISKIDARHGASGVVPVELDGALVSGDFPVFNVVAERLDAAYLNWISKTKAFVEKCISASEGTTNRVRLKLGKFYEMTIPLPPLEEQRRIVARIDEMCSLVSSSKHNQQISTEVVNDLFQSACCSIFNELHNSYEAVCFREIGTVLGGGTPSKHNPLFWEGSIPWVSPKDMKQTQISSTEENINEYAIANSPCKIIPRGSLLIVIRSGILKRTIPASVCMQKVAINQDLKAVVPSSEYTAEFLRLWVIGNEISILKLVKFGTTVHSIKWIELMSMPVPKPSITEQNHIVAYLDALQAKVNEVKRLQAQVQTELDALLPSILDRAFKGEL